MKIFALASLLVSFVFIGSDLFAEETIPWNWDDEEFLNIEKQENSEKIKPVHQVEVNSDRESYGYSDLGW